jgi:glutathione S-transferase
MTLTLHFHPLSSFCQKALVALYELELPFTKNVVDLADPAQRAALLALWPIGKFPVLRDEARAITVVESSLIVEYLDQRCAAQPRLLPADPDRARVCRHWDSFYDQYVNVPMGKIVTDKLRPEGAHDAFGVAQAREQLETSYAMADAWLGAHAWAAGDAFTMADCAAAPALFYANQVAPFVTRWAHLAAYFARLEQRPSFARAVAEAKPYWSLFPG